MKLVVAEKPSVARDLARVLGARDRADGALRGNGWVVTWCIGHLVELEEPHAYDASWKRWSFATLPMIPEAFLLRPASRTLKQWRVVRELLRGRFDSVVNACDAGREGELIFRNVYARAKCRLPVERLWISSLTNEAIDRGFARLRPGRDFDGLAQAARIRAEADWLVGLNATRAMTIAEGRDDGVRSIGRVQTPTLALLVAREREIERFVPQDFWEVEADVGFTARWTAASGSTRLFSSTLADGLVDRARTADDGHLSVTHLVDKTIRDQPPQLFDLTTLQRTANQRFGFSADRTLRAAQTLYERHKMITYPRTSSRYLGSDQANGLDALVASFAGDPLYGSHAKTLGARGLTISRRVVDDAKVSDHHAIIPVSGRKKSEGLAPDEAKIYDLVARRFLAALSPPAELKTTFVVLATGRRDRPKTSNDTILEALPPPPDQFVARGRVVVSPGWHAIEPPKQKEQLLPTLAIGDRLAARLSPKKGRTKPPPRHTDATLLGAMETAGKHVDDEALREAMKDCGLGTPATRASILETLIKRGYVSRDRKALVPTPKGVTLIDRLPVPTLESAELTGEWEARLSRIAAGRDEAPAFERDVRELVVQIVDTMRKMPAPERAPSKPVGRCPRCEGAVARAGRAYSCEACHFEIARRVAGRDLEDSEVEQLLKRGRTGVLRGFRSKKKKTFAAVLKLKGDEVRFDFDGAPRKKGARDGGGAPRGRSREGRGARSGRSRGGRGSASGSRATGQPERANGSRGSTSGARAGSGPPSPKAPLPLDCPRCRRTGIVAGRRAWGCGHWREGCAFTVPYVLEGKKLTENELKDLLTKGKTRKAQFGAGKGRVHLDGDRYALRLDD